MLDQKMTDYAVYFEDPQRANFLSKVISAIFMSSQSRLSTHTLTHTHALTHTHTRTHTHAHTHSHTHALTHICTAYPHHLQTPLCKYTHFLKVTRTPHISTRGALTVICGHAIYCHQMCTFQVKVEQGNAVFLFQLS